MMISVFEKMLEMFEKYTLGRKMALLWVVFLISYTIFGFFANYEKTTAPQATVITGVVGMLSVVVGFYGRK